jgi:sugar lactone lactonase YvrE
MKVRHVAPLAHEPLLLGEGPAWDAATETLSLVDIDGRKFITISDRGVTCAPTDDFIGCAVPWTAGRWLAAIGTQVAGLAADGATTPFATLPGEAARYRANDGKCDPAGRLWVGVMSRDAAAGAGSLCVVHGDGRVETALSGLTIPNGLGWSPDAATMYVTDTAPGTITAYDFDAATGAITRPRTLISIDQSRGGPDGLAVDAEGYVWSALWDGGAVLRIAPDGIAVAEVKLPARRLTSCCFAGRDLTDLIVTTASIGLDGPALRRYPSSGSTFRLSASTQGLPATRFRGTRP